MYFEGMENISSDWIEETKEVKLSLKDRFAIWLLNLGD